MHHKSGFAGAIKFGSFRTFVVGVENKCVLLDLFQQNHPHIGQTIKVHGRQGNRVGIIRFTVPGLFQPPRRDNKRIGSGENARKRPQYSWGGYASTDFRLVPEERLFQIVVRQRVPSSHDLANRKL